MVSRNVRCGAVNVISLAIASWLVPRSFGGRPDGNLLRANSPCRLAEEEPSTVTSGAGDRPTDRYRSGNRSLAGCGHSCSVAPRACIWYR